MKKTAIIQGTKRNLYLNLPAKIVEKMNIEKGLGTRILPGRHSTLQCTSRPLHHRTNLDGTLITERPAIGRPLLRFYPFTRYQFHEGAGSGMSQVRNPRKDPSQRSCPQPIRVGANLRGRELGQRPQPAGDGLDETHRHQA